MPKHRTRRRPNRYSFVPYVLSGLAKGYRNRWWPTMNITGSRRKYRSGGVTTQHDVRRVYTRRRAPPSLRRKVRRIRKRFRSNLMKELATRTAFINEQTTRAVNSSFQLWNTFILNAYGSADALEYPFGWRDWSYIIGRDFLLNETSGDTNSRLTGGGAKFYVDTSIMDLTIHNSSYDTDEGVRRSIPVEIDVYEFVTGNPKFKGLSAFEGQINSIINSYVLRQGDPAQLSILDTASRGVTPFELGKALNELAIKIIKKTKYIVPADDVITYQIRDTSNKMYNMSDILGSGCLYQKGSRGIMIVAKTVVGTTDLPDSGTVSLDYGVSRKYKYKVQVAHTDRGARYRDVA